MKKRLMIFRFNMVEVALALVILAIGLSSVMVLFPVGLKASRSSVAENNLADIAERVAAYIQSKYTSPDVWGRDGSFSGSNIGNFDPSPSDTAVPDDPSKFDTQATKDMDGLFTSSSHPGYYIYRQYSDASNSDESKRAVDFEAMIRIGWDTETLKKQYYPQLGSGGWAKIGNFTRSGSIPNVTSPMDGQSIDTILPYIYRTLIIEISWPADAPWTKREKRIYRVEIFNENFVPYPQTTP